MSNSENKKKKVVDKKEFKEKELYTSKEVMIVMLFSIGIGILMCFSGISIITGKNYLAVTKDLKKLLILIMLLLIIIMVILIRVL